VISGGIKLFRLALVGSMLVGCASSLKSEGQHDLLGSGQWAGQSSGGIHAVLKIDNLTASVTFDCATGEFSIPPSISGSVDFTAVGTYSPSNAAEETMSYHFVAASTAPDQIELNFSGPNASPYSADGFELFAQNPPTITACPK
jgi:hypothetical protein